MSGGIMVIMETRRRLEGIIQGLEDARVLFLDYAPPWMEPQFETMRIDVDRKLRSLQLALAALDLEPVTSS